MNKYKLDWNKLLTPKRLGDDKQEKNRPVFEHDIQRVIFSREFRRLSRKMQVHPIVETDSYRGLNDHTHNRLFHSIEVAGVAKSLVHNIFMQLMEDGKADELKGRLHELKSIVECASYIHDIGNPPFGHSGEFYIQEWFERYHREFGRGSNGLKHNDNNTKKSDELTDEPNDYRCFDGNAQGFRIITASSFYKGQGGMRLTYPTIASMVKYPYSPSNRPDIGKKKIGYFESEEGVFSEVFGELGLIDEDGKRMRHPLSYILEVADDICYSVVDIEDAYELKFIDQHKIRYIFKEIVEILGINVDKYELMKDDYAKLSKEIIFNEISRLRGQIINQLVVLTSKYYVSIYDDIMSGVHNEKALLSSAKSVDEYKCIAVAVKSAKDFAYRHIYHHIDEGAMDFKLGVGNVSSEEMYNELLNTFLYAIRFFNGELNNVSNKMIARYNLVSEWMNGFTVKGRKLTRSESINEVIDYITGMTDQYALSIYKELSEYGNND